jgi:hypothetical protein
MKKAITSFRMMAPVVADYSAAAIIRLVLPE